MSAHIDIPKPIYNYLSVWTFTPNSSDTDYDGRRDILHPSCWFSIGRIHLISSSVIVILLKSVTSHVWEDLIINSLLQLFLLELSRQKSYIRTVDRIVSNELFDFQVVYSKMLSRAALLNRSNSDLWESLVYWSFSVSIWTEFSLYTESSW